MSSILKIDFRFVDTRYELSALGEYLTVLEEQLALLIKREATRAGAEIREKSHKMDEAELQFVHQRRDDLIEVELPLFFRGPFLVMLYAVYEAGIIEIANYIQKQQQIALSIKDIRGENFLDQAKKYFKSVLNFTLCDDNQIWERLQMLRVLRHTLAHCNGRIEAIRDKDLKKILAIALILCR